MKTNDAGEAANKATWEDLNRDWLEHGDLTKRFAKSQFDTCPGCGKFEQLKVYNTSGDDQSASVLCLPCQWQVNGETPSEAIENWNRRCAGLRHAGEPLPSGDSREAVGVVPCPNCGGTIRCVECGSETFPPILAHVTDWVEITDEASLPKDDEEYLWRFSHTGTYRAGKCKSSDRGHYGMYSHYKRITPPTFEEDNDNAK